jgi:hypothetical protein
MTQHQTEIIKVDNSTSVQDISQLEFPRLDCSQVVLTGPPCAGKTTMHRILRESLPSLFESVIAEHAELSCSQGSEGSQPIVIKGKTISEQITNRSVFSFPEVAGLFFQASVDSRLLPIEQGNIAARNKAIADVRSDEFGIQNELFCFSRLLETRVIAELEQFTNKQTIILRDRSLPDGLGYFTCTANQQGVLIDVKGNIAFNKEATYSDVETEWIVKRTKWIRESCENAGCVNGLVFIFEPTPVLENDGIRTETEEQQLLITKSLHEAYQSLGYEIVTVPLGPPKQMKEDSWSIDRSNKWRANLIAERTIGYMLSCPINKPSNNESEATGGCPKVNATS